MNYKCNIEYGIKILEQYSFEILKKIYKSTFKNVKCYCQQRCNILKLLN